MGENRLAICDPGNSCPIRSSARLHGTRGQHAHLLHHRPYRRGDSVHHVDHAVAGPDSLDDSSVVHRQPAIRPADLHSDPVHHGKGLAVGHFVRRDHAIDHVAPDKFRARLLILQLFHHLVLRVRAHGLQGRIGGDEERVLPSGHRHAFQARRFHKRRRDAGIFRVRQRGHYVFVRLFHGHHGWRCHRHALRLRYCRGHGQHRSRGQHRGCEGQHDRGECQHCYNLSQIIHPYHRITRGPAGLIGLLTDFAGK